ncbi:MAG TPA: hypothetical protein VIV56_02900, partial [Gemmatimonadales bacterium]
TDPREAQRRSAASQRAKKAAELERLESALRDAVLGSAAAYVDALSAELPDGRPDHAARLAAADRITNRLYGMPTARQEVRASVESDAGAALERLATLLERHAGGNGSQPRVGSSS